MSHRPLGSSLVSIAWVLGAAAVLAAPANAKAKKKKSEPATSVSARPPGSVLLFSPQDGQRAPELLGYAGDPKAITSPLLFTHIRIRHSDGDEAGQLELEEKAATVDVKASSPKQPGKKAKGQSAP